MEPARAQQDQRCRGADHDAGEPRDVATDRVRDEEQHQATGAVNPQRAAHDSLVTRCENEADRHDRQLTDERVRREREHPAVAGNEGNGKSDEHSGER